MPSFKQRVALMRAHKAICRYDHRLIESFADLDIDHIIPESLSGDELSTLLKRLKKEDLDINSYFNWFPVHRWCNNDKHDMVLPDETLLVLLALAAKKEPTVREEEARFDREARAKKALERVGRQIELGALSKEVAIAFLQDVPITPPAKTDPTILKFSIDLDKAVATGPEFNSPGEMLMEIEDDESLQSGFTPGSLQAQLEDALKTLNVLIVPSEPIHNDGKTLLIRYAVWLLDLDLLPEKLPNAWRLTEVATFSEVYPERDSSTLVDQAVILRRNELIFEADTDEPLGYRYCPQCGSQNLHRNSRALEGDEIFYIWCDCGWGETF